MQVKDVVAHNRTFKNWAIQAYESYVRAYNSSGMKDVFNMDTLKAEVVAASFGLDYAPYVDLTPGHKNAMKLKDVNKKKQYFRDAKKIKGTDKAILKKS